MLVNCLNRHTKAIAIGFLGIMSAETVLAASVFSEPPIIRPAYATTRRIEPERRSMSFYNPDPVPAGQPEMNKAATPGTPNDQGKEKQDIGGPGQPEMQGFQSVNANNMVDIFSGDFSYNIPLLDVGGYPVNLSYRGGVSMDQEASWVGLGWNVNPGTVSRNLRGLPDDFKGEDSIRKINSIKENKTIGVTAGGDFEVTGLPLPLSIGGSIGVFHNNYRGWGLEHSLNASINSGAGAKGPLSGGLSLTNNTQEGFTIAPSISVKLGQLDEETKSGVVGNFSVSLPYNSRSGLKGLQTTAGIRQYATDDKNQTYSAGGGISSTISFASPTFNPTMTMPFTSRQFSFTGKVGAEAMVFHPNFYISGYVSKQKIDAADTLLSLPSYGYLHSQEGAKNRSSLLDFNREKEIAYRDRPPVPHIAIPFYTYDAFSITGEGTGGMFRAYRGDIGMVYDHYIRTKDMSDRVSVDVGLPSLVHAGVDLNINRAFTQNGPWLNENTILKNIDFRSDSAYFESVYFRNPGEKAINSKSFYDAIGGDDVVTVGLYQPGSGSSSIIATNYLTRYRNKRVIGQLPLNRQNAAKAQRDKRTQIISYLTAREASEAALDPYIENYTVNQFGLSTCGVLNPDAMEGNGTGLPAEYYRTRDLKGAPDIRFDNVVNYDWAKNAPYSGFPGDNFSIRWLGRVKAPVTGAYTFNVRSDDGIRLWINDSLVINEWSHHGATNYFATLNLVANEFYKLKMEYFEGKGKAVIQLSWNYPGQSYQIIPQQYLYRPQADTFVINGQLVREKRINRFRKQHHISEVTVLGADGRRHVYGIPVYNLRQKEATFAVNNSRKNNETGLVGYTPGVDNTTANQQGKDNYFNSEETPAYAHSFLLTGLMSPDYIDVTGDGISDDDPGDAIKFNYSKVAGVANPYQWRAPTITDSVSYNPGLKTDSRDDKGNYVYGEKELWYLHSIVSKTMVAAFVLENREDLLTVNERGQKVKDGKAKRIKEIKLYTKADFLKNPSSARPVKTVHFEYSYELCRGINKPLNDSGKLTLKKVWFTYNGNNKGKKNPYVFNYNQLNPQYNIKSYDRWGNFKDPLQNPGSTAGNVITNSEFPYALQDSAAGALNAAAWMLDSINLPSGGSLKVKYESDDYAYVQNKRAMRLFKITGLGSSAGLATPAQKLYDGSGDYLYVYVALPQPVATVKEAYEKYLQGIGKLFFKIHVRMPTDAYGSGFEYISCYADLASGNSYGLASSQRLWIRIKGISLKGDGDGDYSPLVKAASQFLRLNLPSKAYPGSETGDNLDLAAGVKMIFSLATNIKDAFSSFDRIARGNSWVTDIDTSRSYVRLLEPEYKKIGGGYRVKRVTLYDKWDKMTGQRAATYGKEYVYTTRKQINGVWKTISSGVASYEPGIGGEENPFRQPIEYVDKVSAMGPVTLGYSEEPLGESLFPSAGIGYSQVRSRTIHYKDKKSADGFEEAKFFTAYDYPTITDRSMLDNDTKKRYKPALANFLRINARHYVTVSQGFKIELNDMHGKPRSNGYYAETDPVNPVSYTEYYYRTEDPSAEEKRLANTVTSISPAGQVDTASLIGKDVELMVDMREQLSVTNGYNINLNTDMFAVPFIPPFFVIPSFLNLAQREENRFRSAATLKVVQRYGIMDSMMVIDKGSRVTTSNVLYDAETGDVLLTKTQNNFNDPVYQFTYPTHWAYDQMGLAYRNINFSLKNLTIKGGLIISPLPAADSLLFVAGDEVLVSSKVKTGDPNPPTACNVPFASFARDEKLWVIDTSVYRGAGPKAMYFVNEKGEPFTGYNVSLKVIRSGRRNMMGSVGSFTSLENPLVYNAGQWTLSVNTNSKVLNAAATEFKQSWLMPAYQCSTTALSCPVGYTENQWGSCSKTITVPATYVDSGTICLTNNHDVNYTACGSYIYSSNFQSFSRIDNNNFWVNVAGYTGGACGSTPATGAMRMAGADTTRYLYDTAAGAMNLNLKSRGGVQAMDDLFLSPDSVVGPLNRSGVWICQIPGIAAYEPFNQWITLNETFTVPTTKTYYIGLGVDNDIRVSIDGVLFSQKTGGGLANFEIWYIYPITLSAGTHTITIEGKNYSSIALMGVEIYNNTDAQLRAAKCYSGCANPLNMVFSTRDMIGKKYPLSFYGCPSGYLLSGTSCTTTQMVSKVQMSVPVQYNPYTSAISGNWRQNRAYTYYSTRAQTNPQAATNIRRDGAYNDFTPFWNFQSGKLKPLYDTTRWVWNSETTLFNRKGTEIENRDPLGRYNSGLYGYNFSMPTAVANNARYRDIAFESFEDYDFGTAACDSCMSVRHFDFSVHKPKMSTLQKHSGKKSLRLTAGQGAAVKVGLSTLLADNITPGATIKTTPDACAPGLYVLQSAATDTSKRQLEFAPRKDQQLLLSVWVKEEQDCNCVKYENNRIVVQFTGGGAPSVELRPTGSIIEGWQRYEQAFNIPANADSLSISFESTGSAVVYFDDLRLHPFNANMKSFVFNPDNLRLVAELDENNYASFYEYDDDGTLIRVKKETERGIQTIKETRSAQVKE